MLTEYLPDKLEKYRTFDNKKYRNNFKSRAFPQEVQQ